MRIEENYLIGISGKSKKDRDTVGKILQYLNCSPPSVDKIDHMMKFITDDEYKNNLDKYSNYQIKKYADKLKDMVCIFIGCTKEQLENEEFLDKKLGEEWALHRLNFNSFYYATPSSFDDCGYRSVLDFTEIFATYEKADKCLEKLENEDRNSRGEKAKFDSHIQSLDRLTPREFLKLLSIDCGKQTIHPNIWVNALFADYKKGSICDCIIHEKSDGCYRCDYTGYETSPDKWIITDVRFPNEVKAIRNRGGIVIKIGKPNKKNRRKFDYIIENKGNLEDLVKEIKQL